MCGIAGFVTSSAPPNARGVLERMTSAIRHRGPDDFGFHVSGPAFLGHRRLSIVDLSGGHQPMSTADASRTIIFNGEIFNHAEIRPELERAGRHYQTRSDTETILHAHAAYGPAALERFRGMFAFAIWDEARQTLFAARDRLGIKPFYYYWDGQLFAFASEIKALLEYPRIAAEPNPAGLAEYLAFGYLSGEETLFRGIRKLMPGHWLELTAGPEARLRIERYWDVPLEAAQGAAPAEARPEAAWIRDVRQGLEETVRLRLMSDVPLGAFLSGGLDSSAITALMGRLSGGQVKTFSVGYQEERYSELSYAAQVAAVLGTDHHQVVIGREEFFDALPALIWHEDEPITWPSSVSLYYVSRLAAQHVKVVLTGEGSDELFGGYERYRWHTLNDRAAAVYGLAPAGGRRWLRSQLETSPLLRASLRRKLSHTFLGRGLDLESLYLDNFYGAFGEAERDRLFDLPASTPPAYRHYRRYWDAAEGSRLLPRMLYADQKTYLVELLMKQDQMSMATSIESRVPFLDHHFLALAMRVPDGLKIRGGEQKYILKRAVEDLLPREIIYRKKMGFPTPLRQWLREPATEPLLRGLTAPDSFVAPWVRRPELEALLGRHRSGQEDATDRIWRLLNLELWGALFFDRTRRDDLLDRSRAACAIP